MVFDLRFEGQRYGNFLINVGTLKKDTTTEPLQYLISFYILLSLFVEITVFRVNITPAKY
jgi:hypothetical protein